MIGWLIENASLFYALLAIAAIALVAGWWMTRQGKYLLGLIPVVLLGVGLWLLAAYAETDQKRIQRTVEEMAAGVRERDLDKVFRHISKSFQRANNTAMNADQLRAYAQAHVDKVRNVAVSKFSVLEISRDKGTARVQFWIRGEDELDNPIRCEADFVLEDEAWRMKLFELFVGNLPQRYPHP
jgi:hypothetical protein